MPTSFRSVIPAILLAFAIAGSSTIAPPAVAQEAKTGSSDATWNSRFVPDDAFAVILASPGELVQNDLFAAFPIEIFQVQMKATFGIDPREIAVAKVILGLPDPSQPAFGVVLETTRPLDETKLLAALNAAPDPMPVGDLTAYPITVGPPGTVLYKVDDKTAIITLANYLQSMLSADQASGPLAKRVDQTPAGPGISLLMVMESVRPVVRQTGLQLVQMLPPDFLPLADLPELAESVLIDFQFTNRSAKFELTMTGIDGDAAEKTEEILNEAVRDARVFVPELAARTTPRSADEEMVAAIDKYIERMAKQGFDTVAVKRTGPDVTMTVESELGIASGIVISNFLPSMSQLMRSLTRQLDGGNNMRQVMLAMHNYHDSYNRLPPPAITDATGKPLLSWRVALLPFIEEQALYEQFRLDEPWDSEHNLPLSKRLPKAFATAGLRLPPGQTAIHAVVGDEIGLRPTERTAFRDFLDGLSNSILVIESTAESAVTWSKPDDVKIDLEDPLAKFTGSPRKGFRVGMADGAVKMLTDDIDPGKFKALLTRAGREIIQP
jgi:hypothetical protein